jgi:hypothetical protein
VRAVARGGRGQRADADRHDQHVELGLLGGLREQRGVAVDNPRRRA